MAKSRRIKDPWKWQVLNERNCNYLLSILRKVQKADTISSIYKGKPLLPQPLRDEIQKVLK